MEQLSRFIEAQEDTYERALTEIQAGRKRTHWMWFVFPQLKALGRSDTALYYGIKDLREAAAYLNHPLLGQRLVEISNAVMKVKGKTALELMGAPDDLKLRSCMTLFSQVQDADPVFEAVLKIYFESVPDNQTLALIAC